MVKKIIKVLIFISLFAFLSTLLITVIKDFAEDYDLLQAEKGYVTVVGKTAEKGLFRPPAYYVKVDINNKNPEDLYDGVLNRVAAWQMKSLEHGDKIKGYIIDNHHFFTLYDVILDSLVFLGGIAVLAIFILSLLVWGISLFIPIEENKKLNKKRKGRKKIRQSKKKRQVKKYQPKDKEKSFSFETTFLVVFFIVAGMLTVGFVVNTFHKVIPIAQMKTDAIIIEKNSEREWLRHSLTSNQKADPVFQFTLTYEDKTGRMYRVVKEVTYHTFNKYGTYDSIPISYRNGNPFDLFIKGTSLKDLFDAVMYWQFIIYATIATMAIFSGFFTLKRLQKKRTSN